MECLDLGPSKVENVVQAEACWAKGLGPRQCWAFWFNWALSDGLKGVSARANDTMLVFGLRV